MSRSSYTLPEPGSRRCVVVASLSGEHAELLSQVDLFRGLDRVALAKLAGHLAPMALNAGAALFHQGEAGDGLYLISRGSFGVYARAAAGADEVLLHVLRRGDALGEIALLADEPRSATVRAEQDGEVFHLTKERFLDLVGRDPSVGLAISATLIKRLRVADAARLGTATPIDDQPTDRSNNALTGITSDGAPRWTGRRPVGLVLGLVLLIGGWFGVPPPTDLGLAGWHALVGLIVIVPMLAFEALPDGAIALFLVALYAVGGVVPARVALSGYSSTTWVLVVTTFAMGAAIASSGLLYRLALWTVARASSFRGQVATLGLSGLILGAAMPNATGRMALAASAVGELVEALGYEPGSDRAAGLALAALVGYGQMVAPFLTSSSVSLLAFALLPEASRADLTWAGWAVRAAPLHLVLLVGTLAVVVWGGAGHATKRSPERTERTLALQSALLGHFTRNELVIGLLTVGILVSFATQPLHGVDPAWVAVAGVVVMAASGAITVDTLRAINWSTVLLLGMLAGIGDIFTTTRLDLWLANLVVGSVGGLASERLAFVLGVAALCLGLSLVLRWQAAVPVIVVALAPVARSAGIDPWVVAIITLTASNTFFLPYQSTIYMALYDGTNGRLFRHAQARPLSIAYALLVLVGLAISVPYWRAMSLL